jgi:hypothetical protein
MKIIILGGAALPDLGGSFFSAGIGLAGGGPGGLKGLKPAMKQT